MNLSKLSCEEAREQLFGWLRCDAMRGKIIENQEERGHNWMSKAVYVWLFGLSIPRIIGDERMDVHGNGSLRVR